MHKLASSYSDPSSGAVYHCARAAQNQAAQNHGAVMLRGHGADTAGVRQKKFN